MSAATPKRIKLGDAERPFRAGLREQKKRATELRVQAVRYEKDWAKNGIPDHKYPPPSLARLAVSDFRVQAIEGIAGQTRTLIRGVDRFVERYVGKVHGLACPQPIYPPDPAPSPLVRWTVEALNRTIEHIDRLLEISTTQPPKQVTPPMTRFEELRATGLLNRAQVDAYLRRMRSLRSRQEVADAIGAAKEVTEACYRAAARVLGLEVPANNFPGLGKTVRRELTQRAKSGQMSATALEAVQQLATGLGTIDHGLSTLRNEVGTGHGRPQPAAGLKAYHAQLAIDVAEAQTRFIVNTLLELGLAEIAPT